MDGLVGEFALKAGLSGDGKRLGLGDTVVHQDVDNFTPLCQLLLLYIGLLLLGEIAHRAIILEVLHNFD
jgi:hypothetical protein